MSSAVAAFVYYGIHYGLGRHIYYLSLTPEDLLDLIQVVKWQFLCELVGAWALLFIRLSICLFLLRVFGAIKMWRRVLYAAIAFITITNLSTLSIIMAECRPVSKSWDPLIPGKCVSDAVITFQAYYNGGEFLALLQRLLDPNLNDLKLSRWSVTGHLPVCQYCACGTYKCVQLRKWASAFSWPWGSCKSHWSLERLLMLWLY